MSKGLKVRRSKSLYKKKKSGFRKAIEAVVTLIAVVGLGFVGFTIAETVFNYNPPVDEVPVVNPEPDEPDNKGDNDKNSPPSENTSDGKVDDKNEKPPKDTPKESDNIVYAPPNVLASSASLSTYLETAKSGGFDTIVIEMKDDEGRLQYKSSIEVVAGDSELIVGTLTAEQIANACILAGVKPIARISTLKDHVAPAKIADISYQGWLDDRPEAGGKRWANPFYQGTREYTSQITAELYKGGFADIIFANIIFPNFRGPDFDILSAEFTNSETRFVGLSGFVNIAADGNSEANILLEVALSGFADGTPRGTAEILRNGGDNLNVGGIVLIFTRDDLGISDVSANSATSSGNSIKTMVKDGLARVKTHSGKLDIIPLLDGSGLSDSDREEIVKAFKANGYDNFIIRN